MNRRAALIILVLLLAVGTVIVFRHSFTVSSSVHIDAPLDIVAPQVSVLQNWQRWYGQGVERLSRVSGGPVSIVVRDTGQVFEQAVGVVPEMDGRSTRVVWSRPVTVWQRITRADTSMVHQLAALKEYIEDPRSYYGFDIRIRPVTDTLFAVSEARVAEAAVAARRPVLLRALQAYLRVHAGIAGSDSVITGYEPVSGGLVHLVVGIPAARRGPEVDSVRFLALPRGGRLLSGVCDSGRLAALRHAMDRYVADKRLQLVAIPFVERGISGGGYALNYPIW